MRNYYSHNLNWKWIKIDEYCNQMSIHIGNIIKDVISKSGINVTEFAEKINYSRRNIYEIFEKETIDTGVLLKINKVLGTNLFTLYLSESDFEEIKKDNPTKDELQSIIESLRIEIDRLKEVK